MTKAHKPTSHEGFLLRRKLMVEGLGEYEWEDFIHELNHHPCVDFAEHKPTTQLRVTYDGTHWSIDELPEMIRIHGGRLKAGWWVRRKLAWYRDYPFSASLFLRSLQRPPRPPRPVCQGTHFIPALAFILASTNLVTELDLLI